MHPSIRKIFSKEGKDSYPLSNHPLFAIYGKDLADDTFEYLKKKYQEALGSEQFNQRQIMNLLNQALQIEAPHREKLEILAIKIVKKVWNITDEIEFDAKLVKEEAFELSNYEPSDDDDYDDNELTPEEKKEVDKRITLNAMTHGASLHQMISMHHLETAALNQIDPQLVDIYSQFAVGSQYSTWGTDIEMMLAMLGQQGGEVKIGWPKKEEGKMIVMTKAIIFPILIHELSKGIMELLTSHGLPTDLETLKKVYKHADRPEHEIFHYFIGPELWRKMIKVIDGDQLSDVIAALSQQDSDEIHRIVGTIIDSPEEAKELIKDLIDDPEDFDIEDFNADPEDFDTEDTWKESKMNEIEKIAEMLTDDPNVIKEQPVTEPKTKPKSPLAPFKPNKPGKYNPPKPKIVPKPKADAEDAEDTEDGEDREDAENAEDRE